MPPQVKDVCPTEQALRDLLDGDITQADSVELHLRGCDSCRRRLDRLSEPPHLHLYRDVIRRAHTPTDFLEAAVRPDDLGSIDHLRIEAEIGRGGTGIVFRGFDTQLERYVAVKVLHNDHYSTARFERESQNAAKLSGDHVVSVFSVGATHDGRPYLVMPLIDGENLRDRLRRSELTHQAAATLVMQTALGLSTVHAAGLVHRDVKPANILIDSETHRAKLTDFGLVRQNSGQTLTQEGIVCGTPEYMSPEQAEGSSDVSLHSDIYSLGITLYECLTGGPPFRGRPMQILEQHRQAEPARPRKLNSSIPRDLEVICLKAISKEQSRRYASAQALADDLQRFLSGQPIVARDTTGIERGWMWCRRNRATASALLLLGASLLLGTITTSVMWWRSEQHAREALELASNLQASRSRLRESVSRFQQRIFSDEAMHWQMTASFRAEMFADMLDYLDEFAADVGSESENDVVAGVARDYLTVAAAALDVSQLGEAELAATRGLELLQQVHAPQDAKLLVLHSRAAELVYRAITREADSQAETAQRTESVAEESYATALQAQQLDPENLEVQLQYFRSQLIGLECGSLTASNMPDGSLEALYETLSHDGLFIDRGTGEQVLRFVREILELAIEAGWLLADTQPEHAVATYEGNVTLLATYRDTLRQLNLPLVEADFLGGSNQAKLAAAHYAAQQLETALEASRQAEILLGDAVNGNPQNRRWRRTLAELQVLQSHWLEQQGEPMQAAVAIENATRNHIRLLETDPKNLPLRMQIVRLFTKMAELSETNNTPADAGQEFYIAAQDCRLLIPTEHRQWALQARLWLLSRAVHNYQVSDSQPDLEQLRTWEETWRNRTADAFPELDLSQVPAILDGNFAPPRPADLSLQPLP